jgi:hypothetical protein
MTNFFILLLPGILYVVTASGSLAKKVQLGPLFAEEFGS